jgi:hypothetical protein
VSTRVLFRASVTPLDTSPSRIDATVGTLLASLCFSRAVCDAHRHTAHRVVDSCFYLSAEINKERIHFIFFLHRFHFELYSTKGGNSAKLKIQRVKREYTFFFRQRESVHIEGRGRGRVVLCS